MLWYLKHDILNFSYYHELNCLLQPPWCAFLMNNNYLSHCSTLNVWKNGVRDLRSNQSSYCSQCLWDIILCLWYHMLSYGYFAWSAVGRCVVSDVLLMPWQFGIEPLELLALILVEVSVKLLITAVLVACIFLVWGDLAFHNHCCASAFIIATGMWEEHE